MIDQRRIEVIANVLSGGHRTPRFEDDNPRTPIVHISGFRRTPKREKKERKLWERKKPEILGSPHLSGPTFLGSTLAPKASAKAQTVQTATKTAKAATETRGPRRRGPKGLFVFSLASSRGISVFPGFF